jgi:hypothetical protein
MPDSVRRAAAALLLSIATATAQAAVLAGATTHAAVDVTTTGATLLGVAAAGSSRTVVAFEFALESATSESQVRTIPATPPSLLPGSSRHVIGTLSGLACSTGYYFRVRTVSITGVAAYGAPRLFRTAACPPGPPPPPPGPPVGNLDCAAASILCVGVGQEHSTIQQAVDLAQPGDTVLVSDGSYVGFVVRRSGTPSAPISVRARGSAAVVDRVSSAGEGIRVNNASYVVIEGMTVTGMPGFGLAARGATATNPMHGVVFRNNTVSNCVSSNIYASQVADSLIEGNVTFGSLDSHGIYLANGGSDNTVVRGNVAYSNANNGIHLNGDLGIGGDGLHQGVTLEDNVLYGNAANGMDLDGIQSSTIRNNVIYGNGRHAIRAFQYDAAAGPRELTIVNNTLVVTGAGGAGIKLSEDGGGHTIFNNVIANEAGGSIVVGSANLRSDRNTFVNPIFSVDAGDTMLTLPQWRAQAGAHDSSSQSSTLEALFFAPAARDYRLRAGSPAANAGVASFNGRDAPAEDILGVARPQGAAHDQGAFESF